MTNGTPEKTQQPAREAPAKKTTDSGFVADKQRELGEINYQARGDDPERFQPKLTLADGATPKQGQRVVYKRDGRTGAVTTTYQKAAQVKWDDDETTKVVAYSMLNKVKGGRR